MRNVYKKVLDTTTTEQVCKQEKYPITNTKSVSCGVYYHQT